jgi:hypothetical protein
LSTRPFSPEASDLTRRRRRGRRRRGERVGTNGAFLSLFSLFPKEKKKSFHF